jgi:hypothetical protein
MYRRNNILQNTINRDCLLKVYRLGEMYWFFSLLLGYDEAVNEF